MARKNPLLLKINNFKILISLIWKKSLTNFYWLGTNCSTIGFEIARISARETIHKFRETGNLKHLYRNELGKACSAQDAAYSDSKYLAERTFQIRF